MATPDWNAFLASAWPDSIESPDALAIIALASNVIVGQNPPFSIQQFFAIYPKFGGPPLAPGTTPLTATLSAGDLDITVNVADGLAVGQPVAGTGIPDNTFIQNIAGTVVTLTNAPTQDGTDVPLFVWASTTIPLTVLLMFISLASSHLVQARWQDSWQFAMALFVAHFATLYAKSDGNPNSTTGQIAAQGLAGGIQVSKSAGDVSVAYQPIQGIENWAAWNLTTYGQQLATMARIIGMGPMMLY